MKWWFIYSKQFSKFIGCIRQFSFRLFKKKLNQYSVVTVKRLLRPIDDYDDWKINKRPPKIGDIGAIVEILHAPNLRTCYVVECCNIDEGTAWLCDLDFEEIEAI